MLQTEIPFDLSPLPEGFRTAVCRFYARRGRSMIFNDRSIDLAEALGQAWRKSTAKQRQAAEVGVNLVLEEALANPPVHPDTYSYVVGVIATECEDLEMDFIVDERKREIDERIVLRAIHDHDGIRMNGALHGRVTAFLDTGGTPIPEAKAAKAMPRVPYEYDHLCTHRRDRGGCGEIAFYSKGDPNGRLMESERFLARDGSKIAREASNAIVCPSCSRPLQGPDDLEVQRRMEDSTAARLILELSAADRAEAPRLRRLADDLGEELMSNPHISSLTRLLARQTLQATEAYVRKEHGPAAGKPKPSDAEAFYRWRCACGSDNVAVAITDPKAPEPPPGRLFMPQCPACGAYPTNTGRVYREGERYESMNRADFERLVDGARPRSIS
jgi:hypothetical protein